MNRRCLVFLLCTIGCGRISTAGDTPEPVGVDAVPKASAAGQPVAVASVQPSTTAKDIVDAGEPSLLGADGTMLPQTEERPSASSASFERRMRRLAQAIVSGDVSKARGSFFPLRAYTLVKGVKDPERDYRKRLMANFERDIRAYHDSLSKTGGAAYLGIAVPRAREKWVKRGSEGNRQGYFNVRHAKLRFQLANGKEHTLDLASLISWRGEWYVVHLHKFD